MNTLVASLIRSIKQLVVRRDYLAMLTIVPIFAIAFFLTLMQEGIPRRVPVAVVDLDGSSLSRSVRRQLGSIESVHLLYALDSYAEAIEKLKQGEIFGFFMIPEDFQRDAVSGRSPILTYYCNMTYYVPATYAYKGFKTIAVTAASDFASDALASVGIYGAEAKAKIMPVSIELHPIGNPWLNYSYYLNNSFIPALLGLFVMLMVAYTICEEIKSGSSVGWLAVADNSIIVALAGKLIPQWIIYSAIGVTLLTIIYGFLHYPLNGDLIWLICAMLVYVAACQSLALVVTCLLPNLRLSLSVLSLIGILAFSLAGFSFPASEMYPSVRIFSYLLPQRYYFNIYTDIALNGYHIYYARWHYIALFVFMCLPLVLVWRLKRACLCPQNIP